jgi:mannose-6-phosphate isomerase-like protein (cupin superfamily)
VVTLSKMTGLEPRYHVLRAADTELALPAGMEARSSGLKRATLTGRHVGAVHTGFAFVQLDPSGHVNTHLHSTEQSFYVLTGHPSLTVEGRIYRLSPDECGLLPVGVPHSWHNAGDAPATWLEVNAQAPRLTGPPDTFWTGEPVPTDAGDAPDIRDPRTRTVFRLGPGQMDVDNLKIGAAVNAPTVSASMATALLAYSGIAVKMLVDSRLGAVLHSVFMVEYQSGGSALPHDHPLEEAYYVLEGEVVATANDDEFTLGPGDFFWTSVGCIHAFYNRSGGRVRWLETQAPQLPSNYSYRFNRDWDYLAEQLGGGK